MKFSIPFVACVIACMLVSPYAGLAMSDKPDERLAELEKKCAALSSEQAPYQYMEGKLLNISTATVPIDCHSPGEGLKSCWPDKSKMPLSLGLEFELLNGEILKIGTGGEYAKVQAVIDDLAVGERYGFCANAYNYNRRIEYRIKDLSHLTLLERE